MKKIILLFLVSSCAHQKNITDKDIDLYCQDLNVLYQKINVISNNIANIKTTRTPEGGPYVRKIAQNCKNGICEILNDSSAPIIKYEPKSPDANKNGYVAYPNISLTIEEADRVQWTRAFETVYSNRPVNDDFFFKNPRAKNCFDKYPSLKEARDYSSYLGRNLF